MSQSFVKLTMSLVLSVSGCNDLVMGIASAMDSVLYSVLELQNKFQLLILGIQTGAILILITLIILNRSIIVKSVKF